MSVNDVRALIWRRFLYLFDGVFHYLVAIKTL